MKKSIAKKSTTKKPVMKSGGAKRSLRKYQDAGTVTTSSDSGKRTFADAYKANLAAGLNKGQAKRIAMIETGVK